MNDADIMEHIHNLVNEEHALMQQSEGVGLDAGEHERMKQLEVHLDQLWDLLRQRRARRNAGMNPDEAHERPESIVEHYQQ